MQRNDILFTAEVSATSRNDITMTLELTNNSPNDYHIIKTVLLLGGFSQTFSISGPSHINCAHTTTQHSSFFLEKGTSISNTVSLSHWCYFSTAKSGIYTITFNSSFHLHTNIPSPLLTLSECDTLETGEQVYTTSFSLNDNDEVLVEPQGKNLFDASL